MKEDRLSQQVTSRVKGVIDFVSFQTVVDNISLNSCLSNGGSPLVFVGSSFVQFDSHSSLFVPR